MPKDILPTFITKSLEWATLELDNLIKEKTSFEINSFVRIFNPNDSFNQEFFKDQKINYPFVSYRVRNSALAVERAGSMISRKRGLPIGNVLLNNVIGKENTITYITDLTGQRIKIGHVWPIDLTLDIGFFTNTPQQFEEFLLAWFEMYPSRGADIEFSENVTFPISLYPEVGPIDYPTPDADDDRGEHYRGEVSCVLHTFAGRVPDIAAIRSYDPAQTPPLSISALTDKNGNPIGNVIKISSTGV